MLSCAACGGALQLRPRGSGRQPIYCSACRKVRNKESFRRSMKTEHQRARIRAARLSPYASRQAAFHARQEEQQQHSGARAGGFLDAALERIVDYLGADLDRTRLLFRNGREAEGHSYGAPRRTRGSAAGPLRFRIHVLETGREMGT